MLGTLSRNLIEALVLTFSSSPQDGKNNYLPGNTHVTYMSGLDNGSCDADHPVYLVHVRTMISESMNGRLIARRLILISCSSRLHGMSVTSLASGCLKATPGLSSGAMVTLPASGGMVTCEYGSHLPETISILRPYIPFPSALSYNGWDVPVL